MAQLLENFLHRYLNDPGSLEADLFNDISIDRDNVQDACFKQPHLFAKWAVIASMADTKYRNQKRYVNEEVWPQACIKAREELTKYGGKVTVGEVDHKAMLDPAYQSAKNLQATYGAILDIIKKVESAFWHRKSMLEQLAGRVRREENAAPKPKSELEEWADRCGRNDTNLSVDELEALASAAIKRTKDGS